MWLKRIKKIIIYFDFNHILSVYGLPVDLVCITLPGEKLNDPDYLLKTTQNVFFVVTYVTGLL